MSFLVVISLVLCGCQLSQGGPPWSYDGVGLTMTEKWFDLGNTLCKGEKQSPINIETEFVSKQQTKPFQFASTIFGKLHNNGHTLQLTLNTTSTALLSGGPLSAEYKLLQIHFHWGANQREGTEHRIDGKQLALETHMVHIKSKFKDVGEALESNEEDALAVVGIMAEYSGKENKGLNSVLKHAANLTDAKSELYLPKVSLDAFLPLPDDRGKFYNYKGSLTTPTCDEVVDWYVMEDVVDISKEDLQLLRTLKDIAGATIVTNVRDVMRSSEYTVEGIIQSAVTLYSTEKDEGSSADGDSAAVTCLPAVALLFAGYFIA